MQTKVNQINCELDEVEINAYIERGKRLNPKKDLVAIDIEVVEDGEVELKYHYHQPFERIRRITGYLVGTTDRWNDAKRKELKDRVKHGGENV